MFSRAGSSVYLYSFLLQILEAIIIFVIGLFLGNLIKKIVVKGKLIVAQKKNVESWSFNVPGEHQRNNLACAYEVAKQFGIPVEKIKKTVKNFKGLEFLCYYR